MNEFNLWAIVYGVGLVLTGMVIGANLEMPRAILGTDCYLARVQYDSESVYCKSSVVEYPVK